MTRTNPLTPRKLSDLAGIGASLCLCLSFFVAPAWADEQDNPPAETKVRFDTIDTNGDEIITKVEMIRWRALKFVARDLDEDGVITRGELLKEAKDGNRALTWEETADFFMAYDSDGDLEISYYEVRSMIEASGFFEILDYDYSGTITRKEAEGWLDVTTSPARKADKKPEAEVYLNAKPVPASGEIPQTLP